MRKAICILIPLFMFIYSCEKFMHPEELSTGRITNYDELSSAVAGVYGQLALYSKNYDNINLKGDDLNYPLSMTSIVEDDTTCTRDQTNLEDTYSWELLYKAIISTNNILSQYNNISSLDKQTAGIIAEVYFLRAYCFFRLTRLYGRIPLIDNIEIDYNIPSSSFLEIYQFIEKDLQTALKYLPRNNTEARIPYVTIHCGVVKAVLAEVYLNWAGYPIKDNKKYLDAAKLSKEVIDSSQYFGFRIMDDYAHVWDSSHFYNEESVFSFYYSNIANYNTIQFDGCYYGKVGLYKSQLDYFLKYLLLRDVNLFFSQVEVNFYNNYPNNYRKEVTFFSRAFIIDSYKNYNVPVGHYININSIDLCDVMNYRKFYYSPRLVNFDNMDDRYNTYYYCGNPKIYIYRYAQTLLTYAEAKARSGQIDESAYEAVNMIRRRANNVNIHSPSAFDLHSGLSTEAFADSVVWERAWELCGEPEGRWFDLIRLEKVEELPNNRDSLEGGPPVYPITKEDYFFAIPANDLILNPNLK